MSIDLVPPLVGVGVAIAAMVGVKLADVLRRRHQNTATKYPTNRRPNITATTALPEGYPAIVPGRSGGWTVKNIQNSPIRPQQRRVEQRLTH